jgi:hypothetical protein
LETHIPVNNECTKAFWGCMETENIELCGLSDHICDLVVGFLVTPVIFEIFTGVTMKNVIFWDIKTQFVLHRRHITYPLQNPVS